MLFLTFVVVGLTSQRNQFAEYRGREKHNASLRALTEKRDLAAPSLSCAWAFFHLRAHTSDTRPAEAYRRRSRIRLRTLGSISIIRSVARSASVIAVESARVFTLKSVNFYKLYLRQPDQYGIVVLNIARDLARRLRRLDERFVAISH